MSDQPSTRLGSTPAAWAGLVLAPLAWVVYVFVGWFLVPVACDAGFGSLMHLFAAAAFAVALVGLVAGLRSLRSRENGGSYELSGGGGGFLPHVAVLMSALFVFGIVVLWSFNIIDPCGRA